MPRRTDCKDCRGTPAEDKRPAPYPGPRCATCHRAFKQKQGKAAHDRQVLATKGITGEEYRALYEAQGGKCAGPKCRATGKSKALAVDHDHETGEIRGLLCGPHNQDIGRYGDDPANFEAMAEYLRNPPARAVLYITVNGRKVRRSD